MVEALLSKEIVIVVVVVVADAVVCVVVFAATICTMENNFSLHQANQQRHVIGLERQELVRERSSVECEMPVVSWCCENQFSFV
jgi:hypothetical protein